MSDEADNAQVQIDRHFERALSVRRAACGAEPLRMRCGVRGVAERRAGEVLL